jgi:hypothetical protein
MNIEDREAQKIAALKRASVMQPSPCDNLPAITTFKLLPQKITADPKSHDHHGLSLPSLFYS